MGAEDLWRRGMTLAGTGGRANIRQNCDATHSRGGTARAVVKQLRSWYGRQAASSAPSPGWRTGGVCRNLSPYTPRLNACSEDNYHSCEHMNTVRSLFTGNFLHRDTARCVRPRIMFELKPGHTFSMLKLIYLPLRARGEALRMLLHHGNIRFVNHVIPFAGWPALKPNVPNNQLPQLELGSNGRLLPHMKDIALHVAALSGPPVLPVDEADAESALDCWRELHATSLPFIDDPWGDSTPWDARVGAINPLLNLLSEEHALPLIPRYLDGINPWLETLDARIQRRPEGAFMGGAAPHHGDFASFAICDNICTLGGSAVLSTASPNLLTWFTSMRTLPAVAAYLESRPQAGTGAVGKPGSLIYKYADPAVVVNG